MRLVVSLCFEIDTRSTQTPKNRHKMQKIDTSGVHLHTRIVMATVNNKKKSRVYVNQEMMGDFDTEQEALKFIRDDNKRRNRNIAQDPTEV